MVTRLYCYINVVNKESATYWGKLANDGVIWMGYVQFVKSLKTGDLYRVIWLLDSSQRIGPEFTETHIKDSLILFYNAPHILRQKNA